MGISPQFSANDLDEQVCIIKDANGNVLKDGDSVSVIKDLKIKGTQSVVKVGTKVKTAFWAFR
jgi:protein PhnA